MKSTRLRKKRVFMKDGRVRKNIRSGMHVAIMLKADQATGRLTDGIVRDILTNSPTHPHGIKVRLMSGEVGRVKEIYD
jgi:uncharacterized repeat protein (TIGR03833 family)